jgi:hypothetical protein
MASGRPQNFSLLNKPCAGSWAPCLVPCAWTDQGGPRSPAGYSVGGFYRELAGRSPLEPGSIIDPDILKAERFKNNPAYRGAPARKAVDDGCLLLVQIHIEFLEFGFRQDQTVAQVDRPSSVDSRRNTTGEILSRICDSR